MHDGGTMATMNSQTCLLSAVEGAV